MYKDQCGYAGTCFRHLMLWTLKISWFRLQLSSTQRLYNKHSFMTPLMALCITEDLLWHMVGMVKKKKNHSCKTKILKGGSWRLTFIILNHLVILIIGHWCQKWISFGRKSLKTFPMYRVRMYRANQSDSWHPIHVCSMAKCIWCYFLVRFLCEAFMLLRSILYASNMYVFSFPHTGKVHSR